MTIRGVGKVLGWAILLAVAPAYAQNAEEAGDLPQLNWQRGPAEADLARWASIAVPEGFVFADGRDTQTLMEMMGNIVSDTEVGLLAPEHFEWFIVFEFDDCGYVKDDEKDELDAAAILRSLSEGTEAGNEIRRERGHPGLHIEGWAIPPRYNDATHNLEWAINARDDEGGRVVNHNTRVLGRRGVMRVTLVCDPEALTGLLPEFYARMESYRFKEGQRYAEFKQGDKLAQYGLTALVVGGAAAVAVKTGLLKHLWKIIVLAGVGISSFFKKIFGKRSKA